MRQRLREVVKVFGYGAYKGLHLEAVVARKGLAYVLNLHRVHPEPSPYWPPMHPDDLDWLISRLKRIGTFISVEEVSSGPVKMGNRVFALSFDDGYDDFLSYALPVIASHDIPVNINVVGSSLATGQPIWNARLYDALGRNSESVVRTIHRLLPALGGDAEALSKQDFGAKLVAHLRLKPHEERLVILDRIDLELGFRNPSLGVVKPEDVAALPNFVHVGSHSYSHEPMATVSLDAFLADFEVCRRQFSEGMRRPLTTYAFPLGAYRREQIDALFEHGVQRVMLVGERPTSGADPIIPRLTIGGTMRGQFLAKSTNAAGYLRPPGN